MCDSNVGVAKRMDLEKVSKEMADLIKDLDKGAKSEDVEVPVHVVKRITKRLEDILK